MLSESAEQLEAVSVNAFKRKTDPRNNMALIGARSFTLDETNRYPGSYGDPARMAMNYAGVLPMNDNRNDIIIRGNSGFGLQWRIDDIEIPNPNHFGATGTTGGPITVINTNLLARSDFFNSAFPAEYGNAIAGIFDIKMRTGNVQQHEQWLQLGWNGVELGAEGPIKKGSNATYLISYRHAINDIAYKLGADMEKQIMYKDLNFKLNLPGTKTGNWSIVGMGGDSRIVLDDRKFDKNDRNFENYGEILDNYTAMGVIGITNRIYPSKKSKIINTISVTGKKVNTNIDTLTFAINDPFLWAVENTASIKYAISTKINQKINKRSNLSLGATYNHFQMSFKDREYLNNQYHNYTDTTNVHADLLRVFAEYKHKLGDKTQVYAGLHGQYFFMNDSKSIEPRLGIKYKVNGRSDVAYGFGMHSQLQPKPSYFVRTEKKNGENIYTNKDLGFTKSIHNTLGYHLSITEHLRFKLDLYYQYLYDVPVREPNPAYSLLNFGTEYYLDRKDSLVNQGTGQNYGIEATLEQYLHNNFFYLFTVALFESNYTSIDGIKRNTAYNGRYAVNALGGYELAFPKKNVALIFGANFTYAGGSPYVPFDQEKTVENQKIAYDWKNAYKIKRDDYKRFSIRLGIKRNFKKSSIQTTLDLRYRTDYTIVYLETINVRTGEIVKNNELGFYPMINSRFNF